MPGPFDTSQCPVAETEGVWIPEDYVLPSVPLPWEVKSGRAFVRPENLVLMGAGFTTLSAVEAKCATLPNCVFWAACVNETNCVPDSGG